MRAGRKRELVVEGEGTRSDLLVGVNSRFYNVAYPFRAVVHAFFESRELNLEELPPMRVGRMNSEAERVREHYEMLKRRSSLNPCEAEKNRRMEWKCFREGCKPS